VRQRAREDVGHHEAMGGGERPHLVEEDIRKRSARAISWARRDSHRVAAQVWRHRRAARQHHGERPIGLHRLVRCPTERHARSRVDLPGEPLGPVERRRLEAVRVLDCTKITGFGSAILGFGSETPASQGRTVPAAIRQHIVKRAHVFLAIAPPRRGRGAAVGGECGRQGKRGERREGPCQSA
jgi:hypothetical protein